MKLYKRPRLWTTGVVILALFSFLAGTGLACFQRGTESVKLAEDCCQGHCQHAMAAEMAAKCCQSHQSQASQALPAFPAAKAASLAVSTLHVSLISSVVLQGPEQSLVRLTPAERPPPFPPLYALHCALLI